MKRLSVVALALMVSAATVVCGEIFGTISINGKPVGKGTKLEVSVSPKPIAAETDNYGSYRFFIAAKGKYGLKITYNNQVLPFEIYSYDHSTRYDFVIVPSNGKFQLKRK